MAAYCLFDNLEITDGSKMEEYIRLVGPTVRQYGGRYVVRGGHVDLMEGSWRPSYPVMIESPTLEQAHRWYGSEEYGRVKPLRLEAGRFNAVFIEGL